MSGARQSSAYLRKIAKLHASADRSVANVLSELRATPAPIEKYLFLRRLKVKDPNAFFALLCHNVHEILPFVYTPTVGKACQRYHELPLQPWGLYITLRDKDGILAKLRGCAQQHVSVAVVTDGERILGLGDLGSGGMGISEGKIMLYTVAAGAHTRVSLVHVGTWCTQC